MSVGPTRGPVQRPGEDRDFTELFQRVEDLERFPPGRWIYVGSYPADPGTTTDSPPFENGWVNVGGGAQRLRFRRNSDWSLDIEGSVIGGVAGSAGSVVTTLNALYRPSEDIEAPGVGGSWLLMATGELVFFEGGDSDLTCDPCAEIAAHIADTEDAHMASAIGYLGSSDLPRDNVQDAIDYLLDFSGGGTPSGPAGGVLDGTYPNPGLVNTAVTPATYGDASHVGQFTVDADGRITDASSIVIPGVGSGGSVKIYDFTIAGSDQSAIDTNVDGTTVANFAGFDVLEVFMVIRTDEAGAIVNPTIVVNNDTSSLYDRQVIRGNNASAVAARGGAEASWTINAHGSGGTAGYFSIVHLTMPGYAVTTGPFKVGTLMSSIMDATAGNNYAEFWSIGYRSTNAIARIKVVAAGAAKLKVGSRVMVYGR